MAPIETRIRSVIYQKSVRGYHSSSKRAPLGDNVGLATSHLLSASRRREAFVRHEQDFQIDPNHTLTFIGLDTLLCLGTERLRNWIGQQRIKSYTKKVKDASKVYFWRDVRLLIARELCRALINDSLDVLLTLQI